MKLFTLLVILAVLFALCRMLKRSCREGTAIIPDNDESWDDDTDIVDDDGPDDEIDDDTDSPVLPFYRPDDHIRYDPGQGGPESHLYGPGPCVPAPRSPHKDLLVKLLNQEDWICPIQSGGKLAKPVPPPGKAPRKTRKSRYLKQ